MPRTVRALAALGWHTIVTVLTLMPGKDLPSVDIVNFDKSAHLGVYALLCFLYLWWMKPDSRAVQWRIVVLLTVFGSLIEVLQGTFYTDRFADWRDALANSLGCLMALPVYHFMRRRYSH
jgi:VanZ family protein